MNVLVLIRQLDQTPLEREVRSGDIYGEIITFYNESDDSYCLVVDSVEYDDVVQVCIILKDNSYYIYIQYGENPSFAKLNVIDIIEVNLI